MSNGRPLQLSLAAVIVVTTCLSWAIWHDPSQPNVELLPSMARTPAARSFTASRVFPDGKTMQEPLPGTVPREHRVPSRDDRGLDAQRETASPQAAAAASPQVALRRGRVVYSAFCRPCHGPEGRGRGIVVQRGFAAPPSLRDQRAMGLEDGQIFRILTHGQEAMASYASQISQQDRRNVILRVRELQQPRLWP